MLLNLRQLDMSTGGLTSTVVFVPPSDIFADAVLDEATQGPDDTGTAINNVLCSEVSHSSHP